MSRLLVLAALLALGAELRAETAYVDDRLQLGLHSAASLDSTVLELLGSGTALTVLSRDGPMVEVQTEDGERGWVDRAFLVSDPPGRARIATLEAELAQTQAALAEMQARLATSEARADEPDQSNADNSGEDAIDSDTLRELQTLADENQRLKQQIAEMEAVQRMARERPPETAAVPDVTPAAAPVADPVRDLRALLSSDPWLLLLLASVLLLAWACGGWVVDWRTRRRHGGFRI